MPWERCGICPPSRSQSSVTASSAFAQTPAPISMRLHEAQARMKSAERTAPRTRRDTVRRGSSRAVEDANSTDPGPAELPRARCTGLWPVASRGGVGRRHIPRLWRDGARRRAHPVRRLRARVSVGLLVQGPVLLPALPRQAPRDLDAVAGHYAARRDRPRRRPHRHGRHPHADRRAGTRRRYRCLFADAWLAGQLASAPAPARH